MKRSPQEVENIVGNGLRFTTYILQGGHRFSDISYKSQSQELEFFVYLFICLLQEVSLTYIFVA